MTFDPHRVPSPCYVVDLGKLEQNLRTIDSVQQRTGAKILLALKGFAMFSVAPLVRKYLIGTSASGGDEARLGAEEFGGEVHVCGPAYTDPEFDVILQVADHITFNSFNQWDHFRPKVQQSSRDLKCGIRVNPEYSEVGVAIYNPCAPGSRLGVVRDQFQPDKLDGITGLHFHALCEQNSDALIHTFEAVEAKFGEFLPQMQWLNLGGGHHITRHDYDIDALCQLLNRIRDQYQVQVYLEPGEAIALNTGVLVATVLDIVHNQMPIAIMDTSVTAHMPDVLEMPYLPVVQGAAEPQVKRFTYRLAGPTCLAGDVVGDYSFDEPLQIGSKLIFGDMAHYTMVKTTTFNGVRLPSIATYNPSTDEYQVVRTFGYEDYRNRLS